MKKYKIVQSAVRKEIEEELADLVNDSEGNGDTAEIIDFQIVTLKSDKIGYFALVEITE